MKSKKAKNIDESLEWEHEQAKEEIHQAELAQGYDQDEKFDGSED